MSPQPGRAQASHVPTIKRGDTSWQEHALCVEVDPDLWYPDQGEGGTRQAKMICAQCPVQLQCLTYAVANDERYGTWGGLTEKERRDFKLGRRDSVVRCWNGHDLAKEGLDRAGNCQRCVHERWQRNSQGQRDRRRLAR